MFYVIYPELWKLLIKNENFVIVEQGGGGPFDVSGGPFVVLEILEKNSEFGNFFPKFWKFENFQNFELKFPKSEANFDAERGILMRKMRNSVQSQLAGGEKACSASLVEKDERVEKVEKDESWELGTEPSRNLVQLLCTHPSPPPVPRVCLGQKWWWATGPLSICIILSTSSNYQAFIINLLYIVFVADLVLHSW